MARDETDRHARPGSGDGPGTTVAARGLGGEAPEKVRDCTDEGERVIPCTLVIFGASGDLTARKLVPAVYNLAREGCLHEDTTLVGVARRDWDDDYFRDLMRKAVDEHSRSGPVEDDVWSRLCDDLVFVRGDFSNQQTFEDLGRKMRQVEEGRDEPGCRLYYLAVPPSQYGPIIDGLGRANLVHDEEGGAVTRLVVEKPFGHDLDSARALNAKLHEVFREDQVFRIDHYLGKETVQNLLVFRLDNGIFEPLWTRHHVDHVQITVAESGGVGTRAGFYEEAGVVRDIFQNHLMQLLTLTCMEPPVRFHAKPVRDEKVKVLRSIVPFTKDTVARRVVRGQYAAGRIDGKEVPGYTEEKGVAGDSKTETFIAARLDIRNWRWAGTPFYLRSGKRLGTKATEIALVFKEPPYDLFPAKSGTPPRPNVLRLRIQPDEGISLSFESKMPGQAMRIEEVRMDFFYSTSFGEQPPEAYERLILDVIQGDSTLFAREDEVELAWGLVDGIVEAWRDGADGGPHPYAAGSQGPEEAERLIAADGRRWLRL